MRKERSLTSVILTGLASLIAFYLLNRLIGVYQSLNADFLRNTIDSIDLLIPAIKEKPFIIEKDQQSLIGGVIGFSIVWLIYLYNFPENLFYLILFLFW